MSLSFLTLGYDKCCTSMSDVRGGDKYIREVVAFLVMKIAAVDEDTIRYVSTSPDRCRSLGRHPLGCSLCGVFKRYSGHLRAVTAVRIMTLRGWDAFFFFNDRDIKIGDTLKLCCLRDNLRRWCRFNMVGSTMDVAQSTLIHC